MNLRRFRRDEPQVNLTPLIDVVFLLLIFFMVSTSFDRYSELKIQLPEAQAEKPDSPPETLTVAVDDEGRYYVNDKALINTELATLKKAISNAAEGQKEIPFVISADAEAPHQSVVTAMDAARQLGFVNLSIATRQGDQP